MFNEFSWIWGGTVILFILCAFVAPGVVLPQALSSMLPFAAILAITAAGMTIVIQQRGLDMSLPGDYDYFWSFVLRRLDFRQALRFWPCR